ncbi:MAG: hypothetical protein IJ009_01975 [Clostridia bacterium]|nr:hypothetical protein [Clostridia bacterium]
MFLSLLYPTAEEAECAARGEGRPSVSPAVCAELGLDRLLPLTGSSLSDFFTADSAIIAYRQEIFADMAALPALGEVLSEAIPVLHDIMELRRMDEGMGAGSESYLYSITEIELYVSCIDSLYRGLSPLRDRVKSRGFSALCARIEELAQSEYYKELNADLSRLSSRIREVKSVTVGVNLDSRLCPASAGVISVNAEPFKSGELLDKILRMSFRNDSFTCIAALEPYDKNQTENRREAMTQALYSALGDVFRSSVRGWRRIVSQYVLENTDFLLRILPEIEFVSRGASLMRALAARGCPLCTPTLLDRGQKDFHAQGLYNPDVAMQVSDEMVENDFDFDENGRIYILSGPNRGGKSVITCAVGLAQAMVQLGLSAPARSLAISPVDGIYTHFPEGAEDTIDKGRLGEECARLREIFDSITEHSLVLLDESLSSTGAYEASYIAAEILCGFGAKRCRVIFSTHLHELASHLDEINERVAAARGVKIDTLVAGIEEGKRSFRIHRRRPDGKSYARDIADKYGLSFEELVK